VDACPIIELSDLDIAKFSNERVALVHQIEDYRNPKPFKQATFTRILEASLFTYQFVINSRLMLFKDKSRSTWFIFEAVGSP